MFSKPTLALFALLSSASAEIITTSIWAGAVVQQTAGEVKTVTGTFTVPNVQIPPGGNSADKYGFSVWVGIDGTRDCDDTLLQTGIEYDINDGTVTCRPWYEWYPSSSFYWPSSFNCKSGDSITVTIEATSTTTGEATFVNHSTGKSANMSLTSTYEGKEYPLCQQYADWIVEGHVYSYPLADFSPVTFTKPSVTLASGSTVNMQGALTYVMEPSGTVIATATPSATGVTIKYVSN